MIDRKESYKIYLKNEEEVEILKGFIIRNNGDENILKPGYLKAGNLYEISMDLKCICIPLDECFSNLFYPPHYMYMDNLGGFFYYENVYLGFKDVGIIKHIPHASLDFPSNYDLEELYLTFGLDYKIQNYKLSDLFIDDLFSDIKGVEIKAKYSRLYCDVDRYKDDNNEPMAKIGQGYIYNKNIFNGEDYIRKPDELENINSYYDNHHKTLTNETKKILSKGKKVLILDLHSFSDEQAKLISKKEPFPDICIGLNDNTNYDQRILNTIIKIIKDKGYSYQINYPYTGSIIPNGLTKKELENVYSIMIEVNKRIYL